MTQAHRPTANRNRLLTAAASVVGHLAILLALVGAQPDSSPVAEPPAVLVQLVTLPPPEPPAPKDPTPTPSPAPPKPKPAPTKAAPPKRAIARPAPAPRDVTPLVADVGTVTNRAAEVSDAEIAGAATADSGGGGGGGACNMARWLQAKLRKDRRVQAAMADAHRGRAIRVWNGGWVRHPGQDGDGLAAVRESIMWEVAFAPEACRAERVHGLVLLSLNDGPGSARVVVGSGDWRWSDLVSRSRR
ncbi:MAG: hypothetical protein KKE02_14415 [Alphaproteobacteria bacterium]|nr:hypothetical protein [Alphaproteobacteria bacterium]MBU1513186.1 hypothetical protein [Alphaproteobacteria bacterium]MBU2095294.1 hypothetical protein [Alphaproteobacteria bacterium]MBU2152209.1 hypothetical protein [Alphaproteobacteria bacterium]MBU2306744.1 hypothetical protein [Alphaproteobacteria bacterium]